MLPYQVVAPASHPDHLDLGVRNLNSMGHHACARFIAGDVVGKRYSLSGQSGVRPNWNS
jgi:hypothetical protein